MKARPHPGHLPAPSGAEPRVRRMAQGTAGGCLMDARPHLGPLPQERVNDAAALDDAQPRKRPMSLRTLVERAVTATGASNLSRRLRPLLPLPGGEGRGEGEPFSLREEIHPRIIRAIGLFLTLV